MGRHQPGRWLWITALALTIGAGAHADVPAPRFSIPGGVYTNSSLSVELASTSMDGPIRYTVNGTEPRSNSILYTGPILVLNSTLIRARVFAPNQPPSQVASQTFTLLGSDLFEFSSNLPLLVVNTFGRGIGDNVRTAASIRSIDLEGERSRLTGSADYDGRAGIALRGSSSLGFPKQPYKLETWDESTNDFKVAILGFPAESDWVLYPPYSDKTLIRNVLAYEWHRQMGHYAVRTKLVEVFVDLSGGRLSMSDYRGVYVLEEKIKRSEHRVNIERLGPTDLTEPNITGGYIIKMDRLDPNESEFVTSHGIHLVYVDPKGPGMPLGQRTWLKNWLGEFETVLYGANFRDPVKGYASYIDVRSFIDQHWIVEMTKNIDGFRLSNYMYKDRLGKLKMEPIWDWDLSLGNANYLEGSKTNNWYWPQLGDTEYPWFRRLFQDPDFNQQYIDRWEELRRGVFNSTNLLRRVDELALLLNEAQARNFRKWPVLGQYVWPNAYIGKTYQDEVNWMKQWITGRLAWIDSRFLSAPTLSVVGGLVTPEFQLRLGAAAGAVYYTRDGSDPRLPGGGLNPQAATYSGPITFPANARLFARCRYTNAWSPPTVASFFVDLPPLVITELMYHPPAPPPGSSFAADDFEFIELKNIGTSRLNLAGVHLGDGLEFNFTGSAVTNLEAGERVLLVKNQAAFVQRYGTGQNIAGQYEGNLDNAGEHLLLLGALDEPILDFAYDDSWYPATDGLGWSLVVVDENAPRSAWSSKLNWRPSTEPGGSPGWDDRPESYGDWQTRFFDHEQLADPAVSGENADPDHDGLSNAAEYLAGSNPLSAQSGLSLECPALAKADGLHLRFLAAAGKSYRVQCRSALDSGNWQKLTDLYPRALAWTAEAIDPEMPRAGTRYYRVVTPPSP